MFKIPIYLNIRQKVIVGLTVSMLAIGFIAGISYRYLCEIELKQHFAEIADDLSNLILEIRRYEKNYFLYGSDEDLKENQQYIRQCLETVSKIAKDMKHLKAVSQLKRLEQELLLYGKLMQETAGCKRNREYECAYEEHQLREHGKNLVELSRELVRFEREKIFKIIKSLKSQLLTAVMIFLAAGGFLIPFVSRKIIRPLSIIEETTLCIAQGNFSPIPVKDDRRDETRRVVEAFNRMIAELEKRQDQLVQSKKLSSIGILSSGIAHQLNNPLNNISTSCQIVLEEFDHADPEFLRKMLTNIEQEVYRARDIVRGLLDFSRVREFALRSASLKDVTQGAVRLISSHIPSDIKVSMEIPGDLVLEMDAQRMQEVFLNLLMNARQAIAPPGEIRIAAKPDFTTGEAVITVEDTGNGISGQDIGRIFDPFFTTKEVGAGTGLGLSIVYGIIQQHKGTITAESKKGEGARFIIRLPLHPSEIKGEPECKLPES